MNPSKLYVSDQSEEIMERANYSLVRWAWRAKADAAHAEPDT